MPEISCIANDADDLRPLRMGPISGFMLHSRARTVLRSLRFRLGWAWRRTGKLCFDIFITIYKLSICADFGLGYCQGVDMLPSHAPELPLHRHFTAPGHLTSFSKAQISTSALRASQP